MIIIKNNKILIKLKFIQRILNNIIINNIIIKYFNQNNHNKLILYHNKLMLEI